MDSQSAHDGGYCARCGAALRAAAHFCSRCGTRTSEAAQDAGVEKVETEVETGLSSGRRRELLIVAWLYGLLLMTSLGTGIAYRVEPEGDFLVWATLAYTIVIFCFAFRWRAEIVALMHPSTFDGNAAKKLAVAAAIQFVVLGAVFWLLEKTGIPFERVTDEMQRHDYSLWQLLVLSSVMPAIIEEIAFRGVIYDRLRSVLGEREGWLVQAAFFSILHLSPVIFPTHFAMGLILGWLRMRSGSLLPGMILHAAWNAAVILLEVYW